MLTTGRKKAASAKHTAVVNAVRPAFAAGRHTAGRFNISSDCRSSEHGTANSPDGICQKRFISSGQAALLIQEAGPGGNADQGSDGIKHVDKQERKITSNSPQESAPRMSSLNRIGSQALRLGH